MCVDACFHLELEFSSFDGHCEFYFIKEKNANYSKDFDYESILVREKVTRLLRLQVNRKLGELRLR